MSIASPGCNSGGVPRLLRVVATVLGVEHVETGLACNVRRCNAPAQLVKPLLARLSLGVVKRLPLFEDGWLLGWLDAFLGQQGRRLAGSLVVLGPSALLAVVLSLFVGCIVFGTIVVAVTGDRFVIIHSRIFLRSWLSLACFAL